MTDRGWVLDEENARKERMRIRLQKSDRKEIDMYTVGEGWRSC